MFRPKVIEWRSDDEHADLAELRSGSVSTQAAMGLRHPQTTAALLWMDACLRPLRGAVSRKVAAPRNARCACVCWHLDCRRCRRDQR